MPLRTLLVPFIVGAVLLGCASRQHGPPASFVTGTDPRWPSDRYVVGVGEGPGLEAARRQAVTAIASQLRASLRSSEVIAARADHSETDAGFRSRSSETLTQDIRVDVRFDRLHWIRFVDSHVSKQRIHVLAVLDRREAAALLSDEIQSQRERLRRAIAPLDEETSPGRLMAAIEGLHPTSEELVAALQLLSAIENRPLAASPELARFAALQRRLAALQASQIVRVCIESVAEDPGQSLAHRVEVLLAGQGIRTLPCDAEEEIQTLVLSGRLRATTHTMPPQPGAWTRFCTVGLEYRLRAEGAVAQEGGSAIGLRHGGASLAEACQRSLDDLVSGVGARLGLSQPTGSR